MNDCTHPVEKQRIWRVWTTHFNQVAVQHSNVRIVLDCECGHRHTLESNVGDPNPIE